jgi:hypothetical protein
MDHYPIRLVLMKRRERDTEKDKESLYHVVRERQRY